MEEVVTTVHLYQQNVSILIYSETAMAIVDTVTVDIVRKYLYSNLHFFSILRAAYGFK